MSSDEISAVDPTEPATGSPGTASVDDEKRNLMQEVVALLSIDGGKLPETPEEFWYQVGLMHQMAAPRGDAGRISRLVLEKLGEEWDDEFLEADESIPSLLAYETLINRLRARLAGEESDETEDDEDTSGALAKEQGQILVSGVDNPIQAIVQFIDDGTYVLDPDWQRGYVWKPRQRKRFVESILLGLPIPPVLLFQDKDKKIYVIDGRQRLETVFRFMLGSKDRERRFRTFDKKTPGWRVGEKLNPGAGRYFDKLPEDWQRHFKTFVIPARLFSGLPRRTLYEIFKRYNTGAVSFQAAEIRKAVYQGAPLHDMLFRVSGEQGVDKLADPQERRVARNLRQIMKTRTSRYGAYNFVGRCLAFAHVGEELTVAAAINKLMDDHGYGDPEPFRKEFLDAFEMTLSWYDQPLSVSDPRTNKITYHEWVATIQIVSAIKMLTHVRSGAVKQDLVTAFVQKEWATFVGGTWSEAEKNYVGGVLQDKQNTGTHWGRQRQWIQRLEDAVLSGHKTASS